jgi:hypothetical protein
MIHKENTMVTTAKSEIYLGNMGSGAKRSEGHHPIRRRVRHGQDEELWGVEQAVLIVERWMLGRLRHRIFYSLLEVNAAITDLMTHLNEARPIRR